MRLLAAAVLLAVACGSAAQPPAPPPPFESARAYADIKALVEIGPRPAGSEGARRTREYVTREVTRAGWRVAEQPFEAVTPTGRVQMVNLRATLGAPPSGKRLLVAGHYDTKVFDDRIFVGANDGGSSTAFLIELARVLPARKSGVPIELLFLDGEEAVVEWEGEDHTYGSRHYVQAARQDGTLDRIGALVLVDMIGDRDLRIQREEQSTPWLTDIIWSHAHRLGRPEFVGTSTPIMDDHLNFLAAGVPAVDIIDLDYPFWHETTDTLDKVSAESLQAVGDVVLAALPDIAARVK